MKRKIGLEIFSCSARKSVLLFIALLTIRPEVVFALNPSQISRHELVQKGVTNLKDEFPKVTARINPRSGLLQSLKNLDAIASQTPPSLTGKETASDFTRQFLDTKGEDLFLISDPKKNLRITREDRDPNIHDRRVVRVQQTFHGIPIFGAQAAVTVQAQKGVSSLTSELVPSEALADVKTEPTISWLDAVTNATAAYRKIFAKSDRTQRKSLEYIESTPRPIETTLQILEPTRAGIEGPRVRLIWMVRLGTFIFFVDAHDGSVIHQYRDFQSARNRMTWDLHNGMPEERGFYDVLILNELGAVEDTPIPADAQSAHDYAGHMYDYFFQTFTRDSYDDKGAMIKSYVREDHTKNAYWDRDSQSVIYGPDYAIAMDIAGHEHAHGVIQHTAGLLYAGSSGAINEAFADYFGVVIEAWPTHFEKINWTIGETLSAYAPPDNKPLRDMADPHNGGFDRNKAYGTTNLGQPDHFDEWVTPSDLICQSTEDRWNGCVHFNSGILNKAAYLAANGGTHHDVTVTGIGIIKLARMMLGALSKLVPSSDMNSAASGIHDSCTDLIGSYAITAQDCEQVLYAYKAVGLARN